MGQRECKVGIYFNYSNFLLMFITNYTAHSYTLKPEYHIETMLIFVEIGNL